MLLPGGVSVTTRSAILQQFHQQRPGGSARPGTRPVAERVGAQGPSVQQQQDRYLAALLLGSPAFQRR
jgi:hypothetical protein